ncbi:MAG: hypothetical protein Q4P72_02315 [Eubacteriales bacterium]|nr:hypothetical protein [Eubacteriales bacterium]
MKFKRVKSLLLACGLGAALLSPTFFAMPIVAESVDGGEQPVVDYEAEVTPDDQGFEVGQPELGSADAAAASPSAGYAAPATAKRRVPVQNRGDNLIVIGDSLTEITPQIQRHFPNAIVDGLSGRTFEDALSILEARGAREITCFLIGTNSPMTLEQMEQVLAIVPKYLVLMHLDINFDLATANNMPRDPQAFASHNQALIDFAAAHPDRVAIMNWKLGNSSDGVHQDDPVDFWYSLRACLKNLSFEGAEDDGLPASDSPVDAAVAERATGSDASVPSAAEELPVESEGQTESSETTLDHASRIASEMAELARIEDGEKYEETFLEVAKRYAPAIFLFVAILLVVISLVVQRK